MDQIRIEAEKSTHSYYRQLYSDRYLRKWGINNGYKFNWPALEQAL